MAAIAEAVGIGNIWRFPYLLGENGGGTFLLVYLFALLVIGIPMMVLELSLGRKFRQGPIGCFRSLGFGWVGHLIVLNGFLIFSYYAVIVGWTLAYALSFLLLGSVPEFEGFLASGWPVWFTILIIAVSGAVVHRGIKSVEKSAKLMMPVLFLLMLLLVGRAMLLPNALSGLIFFLKPDLSKLNAGLVLAACGQVFFSLGLSWGILITYGDFLRKREHILEDSVITSLADTSVSVLACLLIFPIVFSFGLDPQEGPRLAFITLPLIFQSFPLGWLFGAVFFFALVIAGLSSAIALLEVLVVSAGRSKWKIWIVCLLAFLLSLPSIASIEFLNRMNYLAGTLFLPIIGIATALIVGWKLGPEVLEKEAGLRTAWWGAAIKYMVPFVLLLVVLFNI